MRKTRIKWLKQKFVAIYASACEEAKGEGIEILSQSMAWRIFKKSYLAHRHG